ncbi:uncharacterized protein FIBRA_06439 [Fibroporia radiculosa]|uniref:HMG box domain-containing protein n=1 Tax=Fibroporia radiculosa TaxID=599839 RepID=J4H428_9APHY|nr:uncharacterized protein FIBRA_06439 [Fibroporia radiculosa]CCM04269.1 predicted protein [Fibroporia radiculosa]
MALMSGYNQGSYYGTQGDVSLSYEERDECGAHDREGSVSGSETSSGYNHYLHGLKNDFDSADPEDPHVALTSQSLNADGTPKRPMNAFMIFARKRRPEISAANQMMRTGDVSKILSKEWNSMVMSEKKFYLDQAKKLKDNFNFKYPDYVYRRRPNNSRKKRKTESERDSPPGPLTGDREDTFEDVSPVEHDDFATHSTSHGYQHPTHGADSSASYNGSSPYSSQSNFLSSSALSESSLGLSSNRFEPSSTRLRNLSSSSDPAFDSTPFGAHLRLSSDSALNTAVLTQHSLPSGIGGGVTSQGYPSSFPSHLQWGINRDGSRMDARATWPILPALNTNIAGQRLGDKHTAAVTKPETYSPQLTHRSWPSATSPVPSNSSASSAHQYANASFPTLTSPFVPNESPTPRSAEVLPPHGSPSGGSQEYSSTTQVTRNLSSLPRQGDGYEQRSFPHSHVLPLPSTTAQYVSPAEHLTQWQAQYRSTAGTQPPDPSPFPLSNPSMHSASPSGTSPSSSSSGPNSAAQMHYWERSRLGRP